MAPVMKSKALVAQKAGAFARGTRKAAIKAAAVSKKEAKKAAKAEEDEEVEEEEQPDQTMKRPAAAKAQEDVEEGDEDEQEEEDESPTCDDVDPANAQIVAVEKKEPTEAEINRDRTKELKKMSASDLKEMVTNFGLETGTKEAMIGRVLKHETKLRKEAAAQRAKIREVVSQRKDELDAMSIPALTKLCADAGFKNLRSKPEKVQKLLLHWQETGGVETALASLAVQERMQQLEDMENEQLRKLSGKYGLEVYVKEIMAERISRKEHEMGCYLRPAIKEIAAKETSNNNNLDMIDALLASEAQRKKEQEIRAKREEAVQSKSKTYKAMSLDELKKLIAKKKLASGEKKDEMITALMLASIQEDAAAARKGDLQAKSSQELSDLLSLNGLDGSGSKDKLVKRFLDHEAKVNDDLKAFESNAATAAEERKAALEKKSNSELKDLCSEQGLALGGAKEERIERLVDEEKKSRAFDGLVSKNLRLKRWEALKIMSNDQLLEICEELEVDPLMKDIMVERIMAHEKEHPDEPKAKRARVAK